MVMTKKQKDANYYDGGEHSYIYLIYSLPLSGLFLSRAILQRGTAPKIRAVTLPATICLHIKETLNLS